jgi:hypothetical protein
MIEIPPPPTPTRPRNIAKVACRMARLVPGDQVALAQDLELAIRCIEYHAPEQAGESSEHVTQVLVKHLGPFGRELPGWAAGMLRIWRREDVEEGDYGV